MKFSIKSNRLSFHALIQKPPEAARRPREAARGRKKPPETARRRQNAGRDRQRPPGSRQRPAEAARAQPETARGRQKPPEAARGRQGFVSLKNLVLEVYHFLYKI